MSNQRIDLSSDKSYLMPSLLYIGYSEYEEDWASIMHSHSFTEFLFVAKGCGEIVTRSNSYKVTKSDFIVLPPGLLHTERSDHEGSMAYYVLGVSNIGLKEYDREKYNPLMQLDYVAYKVGDTIKKMFNELIKKKSGYELEVNSLFLDIMVSLMRIKSSPFIIEEISDQKAEMVTIKDFVDTHYMENFDLDDLSNKFHLSKYHLSREFSRSFKLSPMAYLEERRIREARYLLLSTELRVTDIASTLGFSSPSYFSQRFRLKEGMTPYEYRKKRSFKG